MQRPIHNVFNIAFDGIARELKSRAAISDPLTGERLSLDRVIWDTGATSSVINLGIADQLGLIPTGQTIVTTANGEAIANTYVINIDLPPLDQPQKVRILNINAPEANLGPSTEMLIGMDVISLGDFTVQNCDGETHFSLCLPPFANKYDMVEKATTINLKNSKFNAKQAGKLLKGK